MKKVNPLIQWWVTPKLPYHDIYELPLLINKSSFAKYKQIFSQWFVHPIKRRLARIYLMFLQRNSDIKVIGITGSAGKTTTKEILFSILKLQDKTVCTRTYIDPVYNIPNTILSTPIGTKYLVLEMGVEYPGEMDFYLWLTKPDMGIITNIFPTHLEFLKNREGVLREKSKLVFSLTKSGVAILNAGDEKLKSLNGKLKANILWFSSGDDPIEQNIAAASKAAEYFGVTEDKIRQGIKNYSKPVHRLSLVTDKSGAVILDDSYNSNPWASIATLKYFNKIAKGRKIAFLGDMLELGELDESAHRELGKKIANSNFSVVVGVGKSSSFLIDEVKQNSKRTETYLFSNVAEAKGKFEELLQRGNYILVKGSRSIGLDKLVGLLS